MGDIAELSRAEKKKQNRLGGSGDLHLSVLALDPLSVGAAAAPGVLVSA